MGERNENLALRSVSVHTCKWFPTCRKILEHRASSFTSPPKESVLRIFIALKNLSSRLVLNPRSLGPMLSTLTVTSSRVWTGLFCCRRGSYGIIGNMVDW
jgi:hypothetical protein